jgi:hypothetical protein
MVSKATKTKAKRKLAQAKVTFTRLRAKARVQAAKTSVVLKRHHKATKAAAKRYKSSLKSA